jgi:NAD(P)-dependent dehydrogenase (short-subunit alcohol dehydrogenase family)
MAERVAVVTGAGSGIGRAIAEALARSGHRVVATGRTESKLAETRAAIESAGGACAVVPADVGDRTAVDRLFGEVRASGGRLDVLVNNAALATSAGIDTMELPAFEQMLQVNTAGVVYCCRAAWPLLKSARGVIVNIGSMAALDPFPGLALYGATKAFVTLLTKGLAAEGKPHGVRVFGVGPGAVETEMLRATCPDVPADQCLAPSAVADLVVALTTEPFAHSSGQTVYIQR